MEKKLLPVTIAILIACMFPSCVKKSHSSLDRKEYISIKHREDSIASHMQSNEELKAFLQSNLDAGNDIGAMCAFRELGKRSRDSSDFQDAINYHKQGLGLAKQLKDTVGAIALLNQLGTNYRRINAMDMATDCYYEAISMASEYSDSTDRMFIKNSTSSLNGLGNIFSSIEDKVHAEELFRRAMKGEEKLNNHLGMAINAANIGSIKESDNQLDSAMLYYRRSFVENSKVKSVLGIALCYGHFGRLHEKQGQLDSSMFYYRKAFANMEKSSDRWHWLEACISLARVNYLTGNTTETKSLLEDALTTARSINSWSHLSAIHNLYADVYRSESNWKMAFENVIAATECKDSLEFEKQFSNVHSKQNEYIKAQSESALAREKGKTRAIKHQKNLIMSVGFLLLALCLVVVRLLSYSLKMRTRNFETRMSVEKARQEFFTNVTHDFRTPLTVIQGQSNLICSRSNDEESKEAAQAITRQSKVLMDLVNQILDISKIKSAIGNSEWRRGNIVPLITMAVESARLAAADKFINLTYYQAPDLGQKEVDFVPDFMRKIFANLLSNAVKYTGKGGEINVAAFVSGDLFEWKVKDNGIGIRDEDLSDIFTPFFRSRSAMDQNGNGIGLSLVKQMVDAMGGRISVESEEGRGTCFSFCIPYRHAQSDDIEPFIFNESAQEAEKEDPGIPVPVEDTQEPAAEKPVLMVVEDNADIAGYVCSIFRDDFITYTAINGRKGMEAIENCIPDIIITDLMMPDMDGIEFCRTIKSTESTNHIPVVVVTAKDNEQDRLASRKAGADAFLLKPFNASELMMIIGNLLENRRILREKYSAEIMNTEDMGSISANNPEADLFLSRLTGIILPNISSTDLSSEFIADKLCMSLSSMNRKVKSITGMSTQAFVTATRISLAKKMLSTTDKPAGEISDMCGYEYQSYFNRIFKKQTGLTPAEYRSRCHSGN